MHLSSCVFLLFLGFLAIVNVALASPAKHSNPQWPKTKCDYVNPRPHAYMFWWLYYTTASRQYTNKPLILWLQGGPGASGTGFGNFNEIGPLDAKLNKRDTTWVSAANVLFIDNPVGTGFSYTTDDSAFARDIATVANDLVAVMQSFMKANPEFQGVPFYIFSESYGGKMTAAFSQALHTAVQRKSIQCNFKGFAMGDSWISPLDSVLSWGPYLYATSIIDEEGKQSIDKSAQSTLAAIRAGQWVNATRQWSNAESAVSEASNGVNFYNILKWSGDEKLTNLKQSQTSQVFSDQHLGNLYLRHVSAMQNDALSTLMNGPVRKLLKIIPDHVTWGGQSGKVFEYHSREFMKPVVDIVDAMLNTDLSVVVYSGQLDLICDTLGTEAWVQKLKWPGLAGYNRASRRPIYVAGETAAFVKSYKNFSFYWVLDAGHMVPSDAGETALDMVKRITGQ